jgi:hypothetical protein
MAYQMTKQEQERGYTNKTHKLIKQIEKINVKLV